LANIWQNLAPNIATNDSRAAIKSNVSLPARIFQPNPTFGTTMLEFFDPTTRWMVFKVKQRSAYSYFAKTADSSDDDRFKFEFEFGTPQSKKTSIPDYSYNWPFDFFSLIELAKVSAQHEFDRSISIPGQKAELPTLELPALPRERPEIDRAERGAPDEGPVDPSLIPNFGLTPPGGGRRIAIDRQSTAPPATRRQERDIRTTSERSNRNLTTRGANRTTEEDRG